MFLETHFGPDLHRGNCREVSHAHQILGRAGEAKDPLHFRDSATPQLAHKRNRLEPAEAFLDPFPLSLAAGITQVPRCAAINRTAFAGYRILTLLVLLGVVCIPAFSQGDDSKASTNPFMNLWNQQTLTGDWGGARTRLAEKGISFPRFLQNNYFPDPTPTNPRAITATLTSP